MDRINPPTTDDTQEVRGNRDGTAGHHFGNEYDSHDARSPTHVSVASGNGGSAIDPSAASEGDDADLPPDNGRRAHVDQRTGAVHGSGTSAGGGTRGDDLDSDDAGGSGAERPVGG
ncbi:hypothetical protein Q5H91_04820 [Sphingomonas sp. KR1UV-12]|uniref:Chemotaxis protein n=1 Tax=Sphingomonas aurea TaxID=3063994 RepID=A0ABT9EHX8_9SPHN|nr:hypothetical protein [Sphingomonas sp. KR1UV-12]MDP1026524.1 hypothetical protein [Sphingomonas sp. KR1UV-12]